MTNVLCLALIIYMESSNQALVTKKYVAGVAIERAKKEYKSICSSMKRPKSYSWMWDGYNTKVNMTLLRGKYEKIARSEIKNPTLISHTYFNECRLGKRYKTRNKMIKSGSLCFY